MSPINRRDVLGRACSLGGLALGMPPAGDDRRRLKVIVAGGHPGDP
jgi:hypothetical protein